MKKIQPENIFRIIIWLLFLVGGAILCIHYDKIYFYDWFNSTKFHVATLIPGYFLLRTIIKISRNTGRYLAKHGREGDLPPLEVNKLVTTGIYSCMRHPMHLGLIFFPLAFALLVGSPVFIMILAPAEMLLMLIMIKFYEEPQARKKFGTAYDDYKKQVPFFSLKCVRQLLVENKNVQS